AAPAGTSYCFRIVKSDGSTLSAYSSVAEISTAGTGGGTPAKVTVDQQLRGGQAVINGTKSPLTF
ncbi:hypothetical protein CYG49_01885, partial [Candidatus Saccharibacteria bacterium]